MFSKINIVCILIIFLYITNVSANPDSQPVNDILDLLAEGEKKINVDDDHENIVLVLGITGTGKSTFTQYIAGDSNKLLSVKVGNTYLINDVNNTISGTHSSIISKTIFPELIVSKSNIAYYDCPGFSDSRSPAYDISANYFIKKVLDSKKAVKLVFTIQHNAIIEGEDRLTFMKLVKHATSFIKDIDKFKNGIVLIVTKVNSYEVGEDGESVFLNDENIVGPIVDFLTKAKQNLTGNEAMFIDTLLDSKKYKKIGIFRKPNKSGFLSTINLLQRGKESLEKIVQDIEFITYDENDFGFTLSPDIKNYIHDLVETINENVQDNVINVAEDIKAYYNSLCDLISHKIKSFIMSTADVDVDQLEAQIFSSKLNKGFNITKNLLIDITNLTDIEELAEKINTSINSIDANLTDKDSLIYINNQGKYLKFLQNIYDKKIHTRRWDTIFQDIVTHLSELNSNLQEQIQNITEEINQNVMSNLSNIVNAINGYYSHLIVPIRYSIKSFVNSTDAINTNQLETEIFIAKLNKGYNITQYLLEEITNLTNPEELAGKLKIAMATLEINITEDNSLINIHNQGKYITFLQNIYDKKLNTSRWDTLLQCIVTYLSDLKNNIHDDIHYTAEAINENIWSKISHVVEKVKVYYSNLIEPIRHKIKSFIISEVNIDVDQSEARIFSAKLNEGLNITKNLLKDITNLTNIEELAVKMNISISIIDANIMNNNLLTYIENQGKYLIFLQNITDKKLNTRPWDTLFKDMVTNLIVFKNNMQTEVYSTSEYIENIIISNINTIANLIQEYFINKTNAFQINKLSSEINHGHDVITNMIMSSTNITIRKEMLKLIYVSVCDLDTTILTNNIIYNISKQENYLEFLDAMSESKLNDGFLTWMRPFTNVVKYLYTSNMWYKCLDNLYNTLSKYEIQEKKNLFNVANIIDWGKKNKALGIAVITEHNIASFLDIISEYSITECHYVKDSTVTTLQLLHLNQILSLTLNQNINIFCPTPDKLVVNGEFIKFSDFITFDGKLVSVNGCRNVTTLNVFSLNTVFFDTNLVSVGNELQVNVIAPKWDIIGNRLENRKIVLDGSPGENQNPNKASSNEFSRNVNGMDGEPGLPGGPGGNFFGIGKTFLNLNYLYVSVNGGNGGMGQSGEDGLDGVDGNRPWFPYGKTPHSLSHWVMPGSNKIYNYYTSGWYGHATIDGKNCTDGGMGGYGGLGGYGGNSGVIKFIPILNDTTLSFSNKTGDIGLSGDIGLNGRPGLSGELVNVDITMHGVFNINYVFEITSRIDHPRCGLSIKKYKRKPNAIKPKTKAQISLSYIINEYKNDLREYISGNIRESFINEFLEHLDNLD